MVSLRIFIGSLPALLTMFELPIVCRFILKVLENSFPMEFVLLELSLIDQFVFDGELALPMFLLISKEPLIARSIPALIYTLRKLIVDELPHKLVSIFEF